MDSSIDNLDFLEQILFPSTFCFSDDFFSDPLFDDNTLSQILNSVPNPIPDTPSSTQSVTISGSGSDPETDSKRKRISPSTGRVAKRKPRPSKKSQTTFITADADNFQQMVQQATGFNFSSSGQFSSMSPALKQERKRIVAVHACLPTLDTSAFLLDSDHHHHHQVQVSQPKKTFTPPDFDKLARFPTLDSWKVL